MPDEEFRATPLEHRLMAMRSFLSLMLAHLEDNGLIDRDVFEAGYWALSDRNLGDDKARRDMLEVFEMATMWGDGWRAARQRGDQ